jgi:hypothetical protein
MTAVAHFASLRSDLVVVERTARPVYEGPRYLRTEPGVYHEFADHRCVIKGQGHIDFMRKRASESDTPGIWELEASDVPEVTALLAELATADTDRVRDILAAERETSKREVVLETCLRILQRSGVSERKSGEKVLAG